MYKHIVSPFSWPQKLNGPLSDNDKTQCQDEFRNLSGCVLKILTAGRILQISIAWCQIEAEIRSRFPVQKLCLKQGFFEDTNLDHLTSGWQCTTHQTQLVAKPA